MEYPVDCNGSSNSEGLKHPLPRSSSGSLGMDPRYPASRGSEIDSLQTTNPSCYESVKYPPSKSYPNLVGSIPNAPSNPDASSAEIGVYSNSSAFLEGPESNMCFEPEAMDSYSAAPPATSFNTWLPEWPSSSGSPQTTHSALDTYNTDFEQWQSLVAPWPGPGAGCSTRQVRCGIVSFHVK
jgi:hypothetical protein